MPPTKEQLQSDAPVHGNRPASQPVSAADEHAGFVKEREPANSTALANSRSFHIDFYNRQDHYRGRIVLLGSDRRRIFKGIDIPIIAEFISQNLPRLPHENAEIPFFGEISLMQDDRVLESGGSLKAWKPFRIAIRCNILSVPASYALDAYTNTYAVEAWILDDQEKKIIESNAEGDALGPGAAYFVTSIEMGGLRPSVYVLKIDVTLPFRRSKESTKAVLRVET